MSEEEKNRIDDASMGRKPVLLLDLVTSVFASIVAILFVRLTHSGVLYFQSIVLRWVLLSVAFSVIAIAMTGTYKVVIRHASYRSISRNAGAAVVKSVLFLIVAALGGIESKDPEFIWLVIITDFLFTLVTMILARVFLIILFESVHSSPEEEIGKLVVMVYGTSIKSISMVTRLQSSPHYNVVGFITADKRLSGQVIADKKVFCISNEVDLQKIKVSHGLEGILFAPDSESSSAALVQMCMAEGIHILVSPRIDEVPVGGQERHAIKEDKEQVTFIADGMTSIGRVSKRVIDMCAAAVLLLIFSPLFLICFIALKIGDRGPAIFKQERIGRFGRPFTIYKFRSMRLDAEAGGPALLQGEKDTRLTKVGGFLRAHHLDELPQLWNVFIGDMAFVGPRPERKFFIDKILEVDQRYTYLYQIRPGVTSYATLYNGYTDSIEKMIRRLELDLYYLRNRSLWFDARILFMTFCSIVFGKKF